MTASNRPQRYHLLFTLFCCFFLLPCLHAKTYQSYNMTQISSLDGLSQNVVKSICPDKLGNIWIGTPFGLNRYNGNLVENYYHSADNNSLPDNTIVDILLSEKHEVWIMTLKGVCKFCPETNDFQRIPLGQSYRNNGKIVETPSALWFFGSRNNIYKLEKSNHQAHTYSTQSKPNLQNISDIIAYDSLHFAFTNHSKQISLLNKKTLETHDLTQNNGEHYANLELMEQVVLANSHTSLYTITPKGESNQVCSKLLNNLNNPIILEAHYNKKDKTIWLTTDGNGIIVINTDFELVQHIKSNRGINGILPDNSITKVAFLDHETIFLGTVRAGMVILQKSQFREFKKLEGYQAGTITSSVNCIIEDEDKNIWLGTDGGGIKEYNTKTETIRSYFHKDIERISSISNYTNRYLLVASYLKGLYLFDKKSKVFLSAEKHPLLKRINENGLVRFFEDSEHHIWINSTNSVKRVNPADNTITEPLNNSKIWGSLRNPYPYQQICESSKKEIWFCTKDGILCYSLAKNEFTSQIDMSSFVKHRTPITSITEGATGNIVFGIRSGLYEFNDSTKSITPYLSNEALTNRVFYSLYKDSKDRIWAGTNKGVVCIESDRSHSVEFHSQDQKGGNEYRHSSLQLATDSTLYLGSTNGFTAFKPEQIKADSQQCEVLITSVTTNNTKNVPLLCNVTKQGELNVSYSNETYLFEYRQSTPTGIDHLHFETKLEPFDDNWRNSKIHETSYSNLLPGSYTFRVRATNGSGKVTSNETTVAIAVLPLWYQTMAWKLFVVLIVLCIVWVVWKESVNRMKLKNQMAMSLLEKKKETELHDTKLQFFTNISHELKTPLTMILGPLEHLVRQNSSPEEIKKLFPFLYRNAHRMNELITQLLEFQKMESTSLSLNLTRHNIVTDCRDILHYFEHQANIEEVKLTFETSAKEIYFVYDRDKLYKILFNLVNNALKHTQREDKIEVKVEETNTSNVRLTVSDTGRGMTEQEQYNIFERYYQGEHKESGVGIGLTFTKSLIEQHKGTIEVESTIGEGTTFCITLPYKEVPTTNSDTKIEKRTLGEVPPITVVNKPEIEAKFRKRILIVEDEWELRQYLLLLLQDQYTVLEAKDGTQGLEIAKNELPDLILSDVMMPLMDGFELCDAIKTEMQISHIPVLLLTAKSGNKNEQKGYKCGADDYISKPFDNQTLLAKIETTIRNRDILKDRFKGHLELTPKELSSNGMDEQFLTKMKSIIETEAMDSGFSVETIVQKMGMSRSLVYKKTKAITGKTINEIIVNARLKKAEYLLLTTNESVTNIATSCGFSEQTYFSTTFKKQFKCSPSEFRKKELVSE